MPPPMPRNGHYETSLHEKNIAKFLFEDEDSGAASHSNANANHNATASDERFPTLVRREDQMVSEHFPCIFSAFSLGICRDPVGGVHC